MTEMKDAEEATPDSTVKTTYNYEAVCALFEAADKYEVNRLRLFCEHILTTMLCKESIQHILCVADKHDALNLKRICLNYLAQNSDDLLGSDDLVDFDPAMMKELIALVLARKKNGESLTECNARAIGVHTALYQDQICPLRLKRRMMLS